MGSGIGLKMSWWNQIGKGLINKKSIRNEDATGKENILGICELAVWAEPNWKWASKQSKKV